ncbi:MAG: hypothetical protein DLM58_14000 [Pseudonocardiales bacterium]|nr:MAG: hypothetical protein DLM58_14000 [Pseudonocardiales bacterium]
MRPIGCGSGLRPRGGGRIAVPGAVAMPPKGACLSVQASGGMVRQVPSAQNSLDPDQAWPFSRGEPAARAPPRVRSRSR